MTNQQVLAKIAAHQEVQKRNPPSSTEWQNASEMLRALFAIMHARQLKGEVV